MAKFTQVAWADKIMRATPEARRTMVQELNRHAHEITDDDGKPLDFSPGPTHCDTAPPVEITKDEFGRTKMKRVEPVKRDAPSNGLPRLSSEDLASFQMFEKSFEKLSSEERTVSLQKLAEVYFPRLIHD